LVTPRWATQNIDGDSAGQQHGSVVQVGHRFFIQHISRNAN
jgi:hypothetical protein